MDRIWSRLTTLGAHARTFASTLIPGVESPVSLDQIARAAQSRRPPAPGKSRRARVATLTTALSLLFIVQVSDRFCARDPARIGIVPANCPPELNYNAPPALVAIPFARFITLTVDDDDDDDSPAGTMDQKAPSSGSVLSVTRLLRTITTAGRNRRPKDTPAGKPR